MKVILLADVKGVGKKDTIINVSDGYAKNFLLPKKMAIVADEGNVSRLNNKKSSENHKKDLEKQAANEVAEKLKNVIVRLKAKTGENGKIFGAITSKEISEELKNTYNIEIDKKKILLKEAIKNIGRFNVEIRLYEGIYAKVLVVIESL